jgi:hypothetical protein
MPLQIPFPTPAHHLPTEPPDPGPDLAELVAAWPALPEPIRAGILAMIRSASGKGASGERKGQNPRTPRD